MSTLPLLIDQTAANFRDLTALICGDQEVTYQELQSMIEVAAARFTALGVKHADRVATYLPKSIQQVATFFGALKIGAVIVPINPVLKGRQVAHILQDSGAVGWVTTAQRMRSVDLAGQIDKDDAPWTIVLDEESPKSAKTYYWQAIDSDALDDSTPLESDIAAILYTSGSTGKPKGVVLSHRNMALGAESVAQYLNNNEEDTILAALPLSFDAGFSQLTTAFARGATVVLLDYLLPKDVARACEKHGVTGITAVPPLWQQISRANWSDSARSQIRYFANTGGKLPQDTLNKLRGLFPNAQPYLMYGLTEAFRSTYLPPSEVDKRPDSIGKAIPNARIVVVREDGQLCNAGESGELVHCGPLVAQGYWGDPERTHKRFKPDPMMPAELDGQLAVWSGDIVRIDADGFMYFVGRNDDMIKSSGYRVSPTEVEEAAFAHPNVLEAACVGVADEALGQKIVLFAKSDQPDPSSKDLLRHLALELPAFMVPAEVIWQKDLPRNPNGKIDRNALKLGACQGC